MPIIIILLFLNIFLQKNYTFIYILTEPFLLTICNKHSAAGSWNTSSLRRIQRICKSRPLFVTIWFVDTHSTNPVKVDKTT